MGIIQIIGLKLTALENHERFMERRILLPFRYFFHSVFYLSLRLFKTTDTELSAIAAPAIIGSNRNPLTG